MVSGRILVPELGEYVRNAEIRIEGADTVVHSGPDGTYRMPNLPAGNYVIVVRYAGYDPASASVSVQAGGTAVQDFSLSRRQAEDGQGGSVVSMAAFSVSTGREGQAKALMEQKAAMTMTNVIAADSFASLAEGNVAELLQYLPGVEVNPDGALSSTISIRGMGPDYGGLTVDGMATMATTHGAGRAPVFVRTNLNAIDLVELNKTVSADMDASAPAGTVNLKSKSAFQRTGRFVAWQLYGTGTSADMHFKREYGAGFSRYRKVVPGGSLEYSDIFLDGKLGIVATVASTTSAYLPHNSMTVTYDKTPTSSRPSPIMVSNLTFTDTPVRREVFNAGLSLDYKLGDKIVLSLRGQAQLAEHSFYTRNIQLIEIGRAHV